MLDSKLKEKINHGDGLFPINMYINDAEKSEVILECHWHDEVEFIYMKQGAAMFYVDTVPIEVRAGQMILINSKEIHMAYSLKGSHCIYKSVVLDLGMLRSSKLDICQKDFIYPLINKDCKFPLLIRGENDCEKEVISVFLDIIQQMTLQGLGYQLSVKGFLFQLLALLFRGDMIQKTTREFKKTQNTNIDRIRKTLVYIENNYSENITIDDLSDEVNLSKFYFCRLFKEITGRTPLDYVNYYRINKAALILKDSDLNISGVAGKVGFDNFSYFSKLFKDYQGLTPSEFRGNISL